MIIFRRRLLFWLIKAYVKRLGRRILLFFVFGLLGFFLLLSLIKYFIPKIPVGEKESVGIVGAYTLNSLPPTILSELSRGLTTVDKDGTIKPDVARKWKIQDDGKTYIFYLREDLHFSDNSKLDSDSIIYNFSDAKAIKPVKNVIVFKLNESFSPFLTTVSRPIFKKGFVGLGQYKIKALELNGNFVESITLVSVKDQYKVKTYHFYPSADALKTAFLLGEISKMEDLTDLSYKNMSLDNFPNIKITRTINDNQLITVFYNTRDPVLSDKKIRNGLSYVIPNELPFGKRNFTPYSPDSWAYSSLYTKEQDIEHAKLLLDASDSSQSAALNIKTFPKYKKTAELLAKSWSAVGIKTKIEVVETIPTNFQIFLGVFYMPKDPDQYTLWHSDQENNITKLENKRIDKYLEDGRKTIDIKARQKIYSDFQKYLLDESPATFLYFPYEYEVARK